MNKTEPAGTGPAGRGRGWHHQSGKSQAAGQCCGGQGHGHGHGHGHGGGGHGHGGDCCGAGRSGKDAHTVCCEQKEADSTKPLDNDRKPLKIGVTSQNFRTITAHGGKTRRFMIFEVSPDGQIAETARHDLPKEMCIHEHPRDAAHPIDGLDILITGSCGDGFMRKLADRSIKAVVTGETDPAAAITALVSGRALAPAVPHTGEEEDCECERPGGQ
jgi:predicted Fe-Mo cluster-binding NifX family protein